jgi:hypothetical protein
MWKVGIIEFLIKSVPIFVHSDIIYRTRLDRSTVMRVLDTFSDIVCPFRGQDLIVECDGDDE